MAKPKELRENSVEELKESYQNLSKELFSLGNSLKTIKDGIKPHKKKEIRRSRARILTVLREKGVVVR